MVRDREKSSQMYSMSIVCLNNDTCSRGKERLEGGWKCCEGRKLLLMVVRESTFDKVIFE